MKNAKKILASTLIMTTLLPVGAAFANFKDSKAVNTIECSKAITSVKKDQVNYQTNYKNIKEISNAKFLDITKKYAQELLPMLNEKIQENKDLRAEIEEEKNSKHYKDKKEAELKAFEKTITDGILSKDEVKLVLDNRKAAEEKHAQELIKETEKRQQVVTLALKQGDKKQIRSALSELLADLSDRNSNLKNNLNEMKK